MLIRTLLLFALLLLIDWYFFQAVKTISADWTEVRRTWLNRIYWSFSILSIAFGVITLLTYKNPILPRGVVLYSICIIMVVLVSKLIGSLFLLIDDVQRLFRWIYGFFSREVLITAPGKGISRAKFLSYSAITLAAIPFAGFVYGMLKTAFDFTIRRVTIRLPNLPEEFNGLRIVQISDIHCGSFLSQKPFERAVEIIMEQKPDLIFFTGDLVNDRSEEALPFIDIWKKLSAPLGVYSILGNHDYGDYVTWDTTAAKRENFERLIDVHRQMGWDLLRNEHRIIERNGRQIALLGVENWGRALRFPRKGDLDKAKRNLPDNIPVKILLSHDPSHWDAQVRTQHPDIDITLSGHTHGFQFGIEIPGIKWSPSQWIYSQWAGLYKEGRQHIYVNRGLGFIGYMGRVGIKPEITVLELSKA